MRWGGTANHCWSLSVSSSHASLMSTIFNRVIVVAAAGVATVAYTTHGFVADGLQRTLLELAHVASFSIWFGASVWVTFVAGIVMFHTLPRHTFGLVQSKLFPKFFQLSAVTLLTATTSAYFTHSLSHVHLGVLGLANLCVFLNLLYFEPTTTAVMFKRHAIEKEHGEGMDVGVIAPKSDAAKNDPRLKAVSRQFGLLHAGSSICNLTSVCCGVFHLWYLAGLLSSK